MYSIARKVAWRTGGRTATGEKFAHFTLFVIRISFGAIEAQRMFLRIHQAKIKSVK